MMRGASKQKGNQLPSMVGAPVDHVAARKATRLPALRKKPDANTLLEIHMRELGINFIPEYRFHAQRRWRFDYLASKLCPLRAAGIEIEGAIWTRGRHTRGVGYQKDLEKYREAAYQGWKVYRFSTGEVLNGTARKFLEKAFA